MLEKSFFLFAKWGMKLKKKVNLKKYRRVKEVEWMMSSVHVDDYYFKEVITLNGMCTGLYNNHNCSCLLLREHVYFAAV